MSISSINNLSSNVVNNTLSNAKENSQVDGFSKMLDEAVKSKDDEKLLDSCKEFESYFLQHMFKEMQKTIDDKNSLIPKSQATNIFTDFLVEEYAKNAASSGSFGLSDMMYKSMKAKEIADADPINQKEKL